MKKLIFAFIIFGVFAFTFPLSSSADLSATSSKTELDLGKKIEWLGMGEIEEALKKNSKKTIVDVYTSWCGPCKMMDRNTFTDAGIIKIMSEDFHAVKFNAEGADPINFQGKEWTNPRYDPRRKRGRNAPHQLSAFFKVRAYPTLIVLDENFKIIDQIVGYKTPQQLKVALKKHLKENASKPALQSDSKPIQKSTSAQKSTLGISWVEMNNLEATVKNKPKKTIVDVYTPWCGPCKMMDRNTFSDASIIKIMTEDFYAVKFNAEGPDPINFQGKNWTNPNFKPNTRGRNAKHQLSSFFKVRGYPCLVVLDENMEIVDKILGYKTPEQLKQALKKYQ